MRKFLFLLSIIVSSCQAQKLEFLGPQPYTDTTPDGKQVFLGLGDSKTQGRSSDNTAPVTVSAGVMYNYNRNGSIDQVTSGDVLYTVNQGSQWPRFGIKYNSLTGNKAVFVNAGANGSTAAYSSVSGGNWSTNGTLYNTAVQYANNALALLKLTRLKGVIITLGANDAGISAANFKAAMTSLIDRLNTTFSNPDIYISAVWKGTTLPGTQLGVDYRTGLYDLQVTYSNVYITDNESSLFAESLSGDNVHFTAAGNDVKGSAVADYIASTETDKDIRRATTCFGIVTLSSGQKTAMKNFITSAKANGYWSSLVTLQLYKTGGLSKLNDVIGIVAPTKNAAGLDTSHNGYIESDGSTGYLKAAIVPSFYTSYFGIGQNDFITGVGTATLTTASGTQASLFGAGSTGQRTYLKQSTAPGLLYATGISGTEIVYNTETSLLSNTDYAIYRSASTTSGIYKNGSVLTTTAQASSSINSSEIWIGTNHGNSGSADPIQCQYTYFFFAKNSTFNYSQFLTDVTTLINAL